MSSIHFTAAGTKVRGFRTPETALVAAANYQRAGLTTSGMPHFVEQHSAWLVVDINSGRAFDVDGDTGLVVSGDNSLDVRAGADTLELTLS